MEATAGGRQDAPAPASADVPASAPLMPKADAGGATVEVGGGGGEEEDEEVERFYALLANIRALRGMYRAGGGGGGDASGGSGAGGSRKRLRRAEPSWKPTFRMEDFEETIVDAESARKKERRPVGKESAANGDEEEEEGEVVEGGHRRAPASQRARSY